MPIPNEIKLTKDLGRKEILLSIALAADGKRVFAGASDGRVYVGDPLAEKPEFAGWEGHESYVTGVALAGSWLVSGSYDGKLIWWNSETGEKVRTVDAHQRWIRAVVSTADGSRVASVADDMVCRVWEADGGRLIHELKGHELLTPHHFPSMLYACAFSADGTRLATVDRTGRGVIWDAASGAKLSQVEATEMYTWDPRQRIHSIGGPRSVAFSPDGKRLAIGGMGQVGNIDHLEGKSRVELFDWEQGKRTHEFPGDQFKGLVEQLIFSPTGDALIAVGGDSGGFVQVIDLVEYKLTKQEKAPTHVHDAVISLDGTRVYGAAHNRLLVWQIG